MKSRAGKTARDHANGSHARHQANQKLRAEWNYRHSLFQKGKGPQVPYPVIGFTRKPLEAAMMAMKGNARYGRLCVARDQ